MVNRYSININNLSGSCQHYVIFSAEPVVTPKVSSTLWSNVLEDAHTPDKQNATFDIYKQFYAMTGNSHGSAAAGVKVSVKGVEAVDLGSVQSDGTPIPGTTLALDVQCEAPYFDTNKPSKSGWQNAFAIETRTDFTVSEAKEQGFVIGLGGSTGGGDKLPAAVFRPQPNVKYQIQPVNKYYVAFGDYTPGLLIDTSMIGNDVVMVDFAEQGPIANIIHGENGAFTLQRS